MALFIMPKQELPEKERQLRLIHALATRLPWIVVGISLIAFILIAMQVLFNASG